MNWMDKLCQNDQFVTIGRRKISRLLFADDLVLLAFSESGIQHALNGFANACEIAGMKISISKSEVIHLSRNPVQCSLRVDGGSLKQVEKFKYLEVALTSDGRQDKELDVRSGKASAVMRALHHSIVLKRELSRKIKLSVFKLIFVPERIFVFSLGILLNVRFYVPFPFNICSFCVETLYLRHNIKASAFHESVLCFFALPSFVDSCLRDRTQI